MYEALNIVGVVQARDTIPRRQRSFPTTLESLRAVAQVTRAAGASDGTPRGGSDGRLDEVLRSIQTAQGMIQAAGAGLGRVTETLQAMRQLAARAADENLGERDRQELKEQIRLLLKVVSDRVGKAQFNGRPLLDGSMSPAAEGQDAYAKVQTNAVLRNGSTLLSVDLASPSLAAAPGAVSQGTYEVRLVLKQAAPGAREPGIDAVVSFAGPGAPPAVVGTLEGVSEGAKRYEGGGIVLTVHKVSRRDAGMVGYAKAVPYTSPSAEDRSARFQVGPGGDEVLRFGVEDMSAGSLLRSAPSQEAASALSVATPLEAQDLVGRIDDALRRLARAAARGEGALAECDAALERQASRTQAAAAESSLEAVELMSRSRRSILSHPPSAVTAQANTTSQFVLQLFAA